MPHVIVGFLKTIFESMFVFASPMSPYLNKVNSVKSVCFFLVTFKYCNKRFHEIKMLLL